MADSNPKVTVAYTFSNVGTVLLNKLLENNFDVQIYNPTVSPEETKKMEIVKNEAMILNQTGSLQDTNQWRDVIDFEPEVVIFECLDIDPTLPDKEFMKNTRSALTNKRVDFSKTSIIFGENYRGLLSAHVYVEVNQVQKENLKKIHVISSIIHASRLIFGREGEKPRAFPCSNTNFIVDDSLQQGSSEIILDTLDKMRGVWMRGSYSNISGKLLANVASELVQDKEIKSTEFIGGAIHEEDGSEAVPLFSWIPTSDNTILREDVTRKVLNCVTKSVRFTEEDDAVEDDATNYDGGRNLDGPEVIRDLLNMENKLHNDHLEIPKAAEK